MAARMTYSPLESMAGMESDVPVPGPVMRPPVAALTVDLIVVTRLVTDLLWTPAIADFRLFTALAPETLAETFTFLALTLSMACFGPFAWLSPLTLALTFGLLPLIPAMAFFGAVACFAVVTFAVTFGLLPLM